jgi:hypothetical protein
VSEQTQLTEDSYAELPPDPAPVDVGDPEDVPGETIVVVDRQTGELVDATPPRRDAPLDLLHPSRKEIEWIAQAFIASGYIKDAAGFGQAVTKIIAGLEIGVAPFQAMRGLHIINGQPTLSAGLIGALVKRSGKYDYLPKTWTETECVLEWYQDRELVGESSFTLADAERAGLTRGGSGWQKFPKAMLQARALTQGARMFAPDCFGGAIYGDNELDGSG